MIVETKAGLINVVAPLLYLPFCFLQVQTSGLDLIGIADKIGVIGILLYMSYTLNKRIEVMFGEFQQQLKQEREKADAVQEKLIDKILDLAKEKEK